MQRKAMLQSERNPEIDYIEKFSHHFTQFIWINNDLAQLELMKTI